jgi:hypothetical protein
MSARSGSDAELKVWDYPIPRAELNDVETAYLESLPLERPSVEWLWGEMNRVWSALGLDNQQPLEGQAIGSFYSHPVWIANGVFTATDPVSVAHRTAIASYLNHRGIENIVDFGGGSGQLARRIVEADHKASVTVVEPYPSCLLRRIAIPDSRISITANLGKVSSVQSVILQDVLEHVEDPIALVLDVSRHVVPGGLVVFANCFYPVISCHLPSTFHLRHTFRWVAPHAGLQYQGRIPGAEHALVFERRGRLSQSRIRIAENCSIVVGTAINRLAALRRMVRRNLSAS